MLSPARRLLLSRSVPLRPFSISAIRCSTDNPIPANDPNPKPANSPVSSTNELATSSEGSFDKVLQESVAEGEKMRVMQAPNRKSIWSRSQQPREKAMVGPRFEQTIMEDQVRLAPLRDENGDTRIENENGADVTVPAATLGRDRPHPQTTRPLDQSETRLLRRRRRTTGPPENLHQRRQASSLRMHLLRPPFQTPGNIRYETDRLPLTRTPQAQEHHREFLESQPYTPYPLEPHGDPAEVPESQSNTGRPLEQR
ncbi:hypothetical protein LTR66_015577 [Elasticomyces elasticus]|nr:hypothetical protein LTR66_015577 [Elasticomyces elasticus]